MSDTDILAEAVRRIVRQFGPARVVLFGSRAQTDSDADSDFDLAVIKDDVADPRRLAGQVRRSLAGLPAAFDIVVPSSAHLARFGDIASTVQYDIVHEGRVLKGC